MKFKFSIAFYILISLVSYAKAQEESSEAEARKNYEKQRLLDPATGEIPADSRLKELAFAATLPNNPIVNPVALTGTPWLPRGPFNIGGRTRAIGIDIHNENRIIAGSVSGGMYLSSDMGKSWRPTQQPADLKGATCLVQDPRKNHGHQWIIGSGEAYGQSASGSGAYYFGDGLFSSNDSGKSWQPIASTAAGQSGAFTTGWQLVWNVAIDPTSPDTTTIIYAAIYNNIMKSSDAGKTWKAVKNGTSYFTDVAVTSTGTVYATMSSDGSSKGIWRSTNGNTFVNITPSFMGLKYNRIVIGIDPQNENRVYFLVNTSGWGKAFANYKGDIETNALLRYTGFKTAQGKDTGIWENLSANLPSSKNVFERWNTQGSYDMFVRVHPADSNCVFIGGTNIYRSTTAFSDSMHTKMIGGYKKGAKFPDVGTWPNHHPDQHNWMFFKSKPNQCLSTNDGGVFLGEDVKLDSMIWKSLNNGYFTTQFYAVALDHGTPLSPIIVAGAQDNNQLMTNEFSRSAVWKTVYFGDGAYAQIEDGAKNFYFSKQEGKMVKATLDGAMNRTAYRRIDPIGGKKYQFINPYSLDPNNQNIMYLAGGKYLWRNHKLNEIQLDGSNDSISLGWTRAKDSIPMPNGLITSVTVCKTPKNRVYIGTSTKRIYRIDNADTGMMKAVDITGISTMPSANVSCIAANPLNGDEIMTSYSNYGVYSLFYSNDAGKTWQKIGGNLEENTAGTGNGPSIRWASFVPVENGMVYLLATSVGIFATDSLKGTSTVWVQQGAESIGNMVCDMFDVRLSDGTVVVATHGNGVYSSRYLNTKDVVSQKDIEKGNSMNISIFPNPTSSYFRLYGNQNFEAIYIYDELGRIIHVFQRILNDHNQEFDVSFLKSGTYYLEIKNSSNYRSRKVLSIY